MVFQPADGVKSRRQKVLDRVSEMDVGDFISYEDLGRLLGITDRRAIQGAVAGAARELRRTKFRTLKADYGRGYSVDVSYPGSFVNTASRREQERVRSKENRMFSRGEGMILKCTRDDIICLRDFFVIAYGSIKAVLNLYYRYLVLSKNNRGWSETLRVRASLLEEIVKMLSGVDGLVDSATPEARSVILSNREFWRTLEGIVRMTRIEL